MENRKDNTYGIYANEILKLQDEYKNLMGLSSISKWRKIVKGRHAGSYSRLTKYRQNKIRRRSGR